VYFAMLSRTARAVCGTVGFPFVVAIDGGVFGVLTDVAVQDRKDLRG
jgi:hypothetical protein